MNKFLKGAAILSIAGILIKVLGVFFRIPLTNWVGADGLSYYSSAYVVYTFMLTISTAGLPTAISRMVAEKTALNDYYGAQRVFNVARIVLSVFGAIGFFIMFFGADFIATEMLSNPGANISIRAIAPAIFFVPIMSAYRGYFQGMQNMAPTAISQFVEQIFRVCFGLYLAYIMLPKGNEVVSAAATFGCSVGGLFGLLVISLIYLKKKKGIKLQIEYNNFNAQYDSSKAIIKEMLIITIPITLTSGILPLFNLLDSMIVMRRLQEAGWSYAEAKLLWGRLGGYCDSLIGLPSVFQSAIVMSILPMVASSYKLGNIETTKQNSYFAVKVSMLIAMPCAIGIGVLGYDILKLLYPAEKVAQQVIDAVPTLRILCVTIVLSVFTSCFGAILNGIGKQILNLYFVIFGGVVKVITTYILVGIPFLNINGAPISSICCSTVITICDALAIKKNFGKIFNYYEILFKPFIASSIMGLMVYLVNNLLDFLPRVLNVACSIGVGVVVYVICVCLFKMISKNEMLTLPKGELIVNKIGRFLK